MKLHIGCGTVYLKNYINVDANPHYLEKDAPSDILEMNSTTLDKYYKYEFCGSSGLCVADVKALAQSLPFTNETVDEIIMLHILEHLPAYKVDDLIHEFNRVLKSGGKIYIAVPDIIETAKLLVNSRSFEEEDWAIRLIYGTQKNEFSHHFYGYTKRTLEKLFTKHGFGNFKYLPNINFYPAIHMEVFKI